MLTIRLLGGFQADHDGQPIPKLESARMQDLLAYLLLHADAPQPRRHLAFTFWPDSTESQAYANLRNVLHRLRSALPDPEMHLAIDRTTVVWKRTAQADVDVWTFERSLDHGDLEGALEVYTGELLPGHYDPWLLQARTELAERREQALQQLIRTRQDEGDLAGALEWARALLRHDPLHEPTYRLLMRLHQQLGDRASAVAAYQACVDVIQRELGADVSPETKALHDAILAAEEPATTRAPVPPPAGRRNLPTPLTSFIGRRGTLAELRPRLLEARLLTLTGPGGVGKSRLALELARSLIDDLPDGSWWVELAAIADPTHVPGAVASALGVPQEGDEPIQERLLAFLRPKRLLLVLDNCEHLMGTVQRACEGWLKECRNLKILATSREALRLPGEQVHLVDPLAAPASGEIEPEAVSSSEAGALFLERTADVLPTFKLDRDNAPAVAEVCRRLEGIPLALELAAGQMRALSPAEIAGRLDDALGLLAGGSPLAPERQQTLRGAIDWSYQLLADPERALLRCLAVFSGGWTLAAAEFVASNPEQPGEPTLNRVDVLPTLSRLLEKSLIHVARRTPPTRYGMLDVVCQFARRRLGEADEGDLAAQRHYSFFLDLANRAQDGLTGPDQFDWLRRLSDERDNFRAALAWGLETDRAHLALALAVELVPLWDLGEAFEEGLRWIESGLRGTDTDRDLELFVGAQLGRAQLLYALGSYDEGREATAAVHNLAAGPQADLWRGRAYLLDGYFDWRAGDYQGAVGSLRRAARDLESLDPHGAADATHVLGHVLLDSGETQAAHEHFEDSLARFRQLGDSLEVASLIGDLGLAAYFRGEVSTARRHLEEALGIYERAGKEKGIAQIANRLGDLARCDGNHARAATFYRRSLELAERLQARADLISAQHNLGYTSLATQETVPAAAWFRRSLELAQGMDDPKGVVDALAGLAAVAADGGQADLAVRIYAACQTRRSDLGAPAWPANEMETERRLGALRSDLGTEGFDAAWQGGAELSLQQVLEEAQDLAGA